MRAHRMSRSIAALVSALCLFGALMTGAVSAKAAEDTNKVAYDFFVNKGLSREQSAGVVGNLMQESGNPVNPQAQQAGGPGRGIAQWSEGERWATLQGFAAEQGRDQWDLGLQLDFLWHELETTESAAMEALRGAGSVEDATIAFSHKFERCGDCHDEQRIDYAKTVFNAFAQEPQPEPKPEAEPAPPAPGGADGFSTDEVSLREGTATSATELAVVPPNTKITLQCQSRGENIAGTYNSDWWAKTEFNGKTGYVSRAYVRVPVGQNLNECSEPAPKQEAQPAPPAESEVNGKISRAEVLARAQNWVDRKVPYSMDVNTGDPQGKDYRTDCSGFVSMALHLDVSLSTVTLPERLTPINKDDLKPGDIVGNLGPGTAGANGHVVIFNGWTDDSKTTFNTLEQTPDFAQSKPRTWGSDFFLHEAYRYNNIAD